MVLSQDGTSDNPVDQVAAEPQQRELDFESRERFVRGLAISPRLQDLTLAVDRLALTQGDRDGVSTCNPSTAELAAIIGCSVRRVYLALADVKRLQETVGFPYLTIGRRSGLGTARGDLLTVHWGPIIEDSRRQPSTENCKATTAQLQTAKLQSPLLYSSSSDPITVRKEEEKEHAGLQLQSCSPAVPEKSQAEQLYEAYPRKAARGDALKAIQKALRKESFEVLLASVQAFAESPKAKGCFCPHAATWFNGERWADDPREWEASPTAKPGTAGFYSGLQSFAKG